MLGLVDRAPATANSNLRLVPLWAVANKILGGIETSTRFIYNDPFEGKLLSLYQQVYICAESQIKTVGGVPVLHPDGHTSIRTYIHPDDRTSSRPKT